MTDLDWVPQSCTLPTEEQPLRIAEWDELLTERLTALSRPGPQRLRLELSDAAAAEDRVRDLAERESGCCSFFTFEVTVVAGAVRLDIGVDAVHEAVLEALAERATRLTGHGEQQ
ncbi:hypothetical protein [Streptomyces sp. AC550_RSS872]|uniref:hypothetical protein n=1 Tax=Streptomyces sp. AC550_RSS872 TaxID=2823689 RepID=UPI001C27A910|nr:hypothetical protein [Streptomyces sp. AC550_RSS872]